MSLATEKDEILIRLRSEESDLNLAHYEFTFGDQKAFGDLFYSHRDELVLDGYISCYPEIEEANSDTLLVSILPEGRVFIKNGGYTRIEQNAEKAERRKEQEWRWRRGYESSTLIIAGFAFILSIVAFCSTPRENQIKDIQQRIDSLRQQVNRINQLKVNPQKNIEGKSTVEVTSPVSRTNAR